MTQPHILIIKLRVPLKTEVKQFLSEDKKKMYYYYAGKEKKAGEVKKSEREIAPYQWDSDRMMERVQRDFEDFWAIPPRWRQWMRGRPGFSMMPFKGMPSVDVEDRGKDY